MRNSFFFFSFSSSSPYPERPRLFESFVIVKNQLSNGVPVKVLMGSSIDCQKLSSCLTLFRLVLDCLTFSSQEETKSFIKQISEIQSILKEQGFPPCQFTLQQIPSQKKELQSQQQQLTPAMICAVLTGIVVLALFLVFGLL